MITGTKIKQISFPETVDRLAEMGYKYIDSLQVDKWDLRELPTVTIGEPWAFYAHVENDHYYIFYGEGSSPDTTVCDVFVKEAQS